MEVVIKAGLGEDCRYYVDFGGLVLVIPRKGMFRLGLAFYHVSMGNFVVGEAGQRVDIDDSRVLVMSSKSSVSSYNQICGQTHTLQGLVTRLVFETRVGDLVCLLLGRWLGLGLVCVEHL